MSQTKKLLHHNRRSMRTRAKIWGVAERPRLSVFKSNKHIYAQVIDDEKGITLLASMDAGLSSKKKMTLKERAAEVGVDIAQKAKQKKITKVVFDRGGFLYAGVIQALAEAARKGGLSF